MRHATARRRPLPKLLVTSGDIELLDAGLGRGPIEMVSRGYGNCRELTGARGVWSVHFNANGALILDTLEVGGCRARSSLAPEDFEDASVRLRELLDKG